MLFPKPGMTNGLTTQDLAQLDPANLAQSQGLFQTNPQFQGGQPRVFDSPAQVVGPQPLDDSVAQSLFASRQMTPEGMKIGHQTPPPAAAVNTQAQAGLTQSVNPPSQMIGQTAMGLPSPQDVAAHKQLFQTRIR